MSDDSTPSKDKLAAVWGKRPECVQLIGRPFYGYFPIMTHGDEYGATPTSDFRVVFSSVINFVPLSLAAYHAGDLHRPDKAKEYLIRTQVEVMKAVERGAYQITENDNLFLNFIACWWNNPHGHGLLEQAAAMPLEDITVR